MSARRTRSGHPVGESSSAPALASTSAPALDTSSLLEDLTCPLCMDVPEAEIHQCNRGHIFCHDCLQAHRDSGRGEASSKCPTCRTALGSTPIRNRIAEAAVSNLPGSCKGCSTEMLRKHLRDHQKTCGKVEVACPFPGCPVRLRREDLAAHAASAAAEHQTIAVAHLVELESARARLASLKVHIRLKVSGIREPLRLESHRPREVALGLFEPIESQEAFTTLARLLMDGAEEFSSPIDLAKTPHELGLRDGFPLTLALGPTTVNLKVRDASGSECFFKLKITTVLHKLFACYCSRMHIARSSAVFTFRGRRIAPEQTPLDLRMEEGDAIDVAVTQAVALA